MNFRLSIVLNTLLATLLLSACVGVDGAPLFTLPPGQAAPARPMSTSECPQPTAASQLFHHDRYGYCLLYPAGYVVMRLATMDEVVILAPPTTAGHRERLLINVKAAADRTLDEATQQFVTDYGLPSLPLTVTTDLRIGSVPAALIEPVPGQEFSRHLLFLHAGQSYDLTFLPDDPTQPEAYAEMETLYRVVIASFTLIPQQSS